MDKNTSVIIDKSHTFSYVERYLVDLRVPNTIIMFEEEFEITIKLDNPTNNNITGTLSLEIESQFREEELWCKKVLLQLLTSDEITSKFIFKKNDNWLTGAVQIKVKFTPDSDPDNEDEIIKRINLAKQEAGILNNIMFSKQLDMFEPVEMDSDGNVKINVLDYMFERVDTKDGLNIQLFQITIADILYEVFKDQLPDDLPYYRFQEKFMNVIRNTFGRD